jgi:hypothetical protein
MLQEFQAGDFLIFQLESGYGLMRVLAVDEPAGDTVWHVAAYDDLFLDPEMADLALADPENLSVSLPHVALTNRAFESTQTAKMTNVPLKAEEAARVNDWRSSNGQVADRPIRLMMGLR